MSLGSSDMAGGALGTAFSLLLLASITQGLQDVEVFHYEKLEGVVGQNVTLPCTINGRPDLKIISMEWSKNKNEKLALYGRGLGFNLFWPNVTMQNTSNGSYLHLFKVEKWDSGIYVCDTATFPLGSIRRETVLEIKDDVQISCDMNSTVEVHAGDNVTIHCSAFPDARYKWTKNKMLVSENKSLGLRCVTEAHTGVYTLTVSTGHKSLHKEFTITVLAATTSLRTDLVTVPPHFNLTEGGLIESADGGPTASPTAELSTRSADATAYIPNSTEKTTSVTNLTRISITSSPVTHSDLYHFNSSTDQQINLTRSTSSDQSVSSNITTTFNYGDSVTRSTQDGRNESRTGIAGSSPTLSTEIPTIFVVDEDSDAVRSHLLLVLIIVPILVLIALAGFFYRRQIIRERMDLPPPFKPPPPPVKYTSVRHIEIQRFPTSRCNSVTELKDMQQMFINI